MKFDVVATGKAGNDSGEDSIPDDLMMKATLEAERIAMESGRIGKAEIEQQNSLKKKDDRDEAGDGSDGRTCTLYYVTADMVSRTYMVSQCAEVVLRSRPLVMDETSECAVFDDEEKAHLFGKTYSHAESSKICYGDLPSDSCCLAVCDVENCVYNVLVLSSSDMNVEVISKPGYVTNTYRMIGQAVQFVEAFKKTMNTRSRKALV